jgi:MFS family permease
MKDTRWEPSPGFIVALICIPIFIGAVDLTVVSAVLPHVIYDLEIPLNTGLDEAAWIVSGYLLAYSVAMTFMGRLSDIHGRRRVFLISLGIFALGSYLVAVADTWPTRLVTRSYSWLLGGGRPDTSQVALYTIIASRMVQAFGAGAMVPVGMAVVADLFPVGKRAKMLGLVAAVDTAGWVIGHLYGGIVVRYFDWRMIFWLNLPICAVAFLLIAVVLRDPDRQESLPSMDWLGALLISISLALFNIGLGAGSETSGALSSSGYTQLPKHMIPTVLAALVVLGLFIYRETRASSPLIQLDLFRRANFSAASGANFLLGVGLFIAIASVPLFINTLVAQTLEQGAWDSGWLLSALTVPMAFAAIPGGWLTERTNYRWPSIVGLLMAIGGFLLMTTWRASTPYTTMIPQLVLTGVGFGLTMAPIATAALDSAPQDHRGTASGLVILFRLVGMTVGVSGITTYGLHRTNSMTAQLTGPEMSLSEMAQTLTTITETVISETFFIACVICLLTILPVLRIKSIQDRR